MTTTGLHANTVKHLEWVAALCVGDFCDRYNNLKYARWREQLCEMFLERVTTPEEVLSFFDLCSCNMSPQQMADVARRKDELRQREHKQQEQPRVQAA